MSFELSPVEPEIEEPVQRLSFSARATMQFLMSPGGSIPIPASGGRNSAFVCDCHNGSYIPCEALQPGKQCRKTVPPPIVTILGPKESLYSTAFVIIPRRPEAVLLLFLFLPRAHRTRLPKR